MHPAAAAATVLVDELVRGGVRHLVLCPGSRSAPLAYAALAAHDAGRLTLHVRIDERSAGFLALGLASTGVPAVVATTSGTAVANLHPAVLEASHAAVPVVVLTADRPPELRGSGANQTTQQVGLFGAAVRWSADLGVPDGRLGQVADWRATVCRALAAATGSRAGTAGPVHLNLPLREPLVPDGDPVFVEPLDGRPDGGPWTSVAPWTTAPRSSAGAALGPRTLVLVGDLPAGGVDAGAAAADLAAARGWPLVAEPSSGGAWSRAVPGGSLLLTCADWLERHRPDAVLVVGRVTLSRAAAALLRDAHTVVELVSDDLVWPDPAHLARCVHPLAALAVGLAEGAETGGAWAAAWAAAGRRVAASAADVVDAAWPSGPALAAAVSSALPAGATLFTGSSTPVRDLDLVGSPGARVLANRGLAGIDGCLATALGLVLATPAPTYALVGDLTFVHDANALVVGPHEPRPDLTVVVLNDDGGGIFTLLEPGAPERGASFERVFGTPHGTDLAALCAASGTRHVLVTDRDRLRTELARPPSGVSVLEVRVDRAGHRDLAARLRSAAAAAAG